ncbi:hypothetical protein DDV96_04210 [Marixanthomonas spongiae]|uniref:Uncharacterized protein n=1 Tax=Marixanthomonas spongiae TaxID=2174845 RepID=A0A2U0I642_9FLAO|nr:hypothetical protein DDV96_04210 [Marixanthomonas spongiae]
MCGCLAVQSNRCPPGWQKPFLSSA